jgi:hypothetical protein
MSPEKFEELLSGYDRIPYSQEGYQNSNQTNFGFYGS